MRATVSPNHSSQGRLPAHLDGQGENLETRGKEAGVLYTVCNLRAGGQ